jgi:hypothetical protein
MIFGTIDWFLRQKYAIIEVGRKKIIDKLRLTNIGKDGLIGTSRYYLVLAIPQQSMNELVSPDDFRF